MNITEEFKSAEKITPYTTINVKALSINMCFQGRRFKTPAYAKYERDILLMLPKLKIGNAPYELYLDVGFSNRSQDLDNICKPFLDCLVKKYKNQGFDDRQIYLLTVKKTIVKKGKEYISFKLKSIQ